MSRPTARRLTLTAALLLGGLFSAPAVAAAEQVELGEGNLQVQQPTISGIVAFDQVTVDTDPIVDTADNVTDDDVTDDDVTDDDVTDDDVTDDDVADDTVDIGQDTTDPTDDTEVLDQPSTDTVCTPVLVRIAPDRIQGDQQAVAITSQMIELGVERWIAVSWQASPATRLTAVSIITPDRVTTRTGDLQTGTAQDATELVFCGHHTSTDTPADDSTDTPADDSTDTPADDSTDTPAEDADRESTGPDTDNDPAASTPAVPAPPTTDQADTPPATTPQAPTPAPTLPDTTPQPDATIVPAAAGQDPAAAGQDPAAADEDAEVLGLLEERDDTDPSTHPQTGPEAPADNQADDQADTDQADTDQSDTDQDPEVLGLLQDRTGDNHRGARSPLPMLALLVAALAALGAWTLLRRRATHTHPTDPT